METQENHAITTRTIINIIVIIKRRFRWVRCICMRKSSTQKASSNISYGVWFDEHCLCMDAIIKFINDEVCNSECCLVEKIRIGKCGVCLKMTLFVKMDGSTIKSDVFVFFYITRVECPLTLSRVQASSKRKPDNLVNFVISQNCQWTLLLKVSQWNGLLHRVDSVRTRRLAEKFRFQVKHWKLHLKMKLF